MMSPIRPLLGRPGSRSFWRLATAVALLVTANVACGTSAESAYADDTVPMAASRGGAGSEGEESPSCAPVVAGLVLADIAPLEVHCPGGYTQRKSLAALPIAGRFTTAAELTDAFCISTKGDTTAPNIDPRTPTFEQEVDFEKSDVVAYAFDTQAGEPAIYSRGEDLWLKVTTDKCGANAPRLGTIAFAVPKDKKVNEQTCARACE
jgi:hypothetical protein